MNNNYGMVRGDRPPIDMRHTGWVDPEYGNGGVWILTAGGGGISPDDLPVPNVDNPVTPNTPQTVKTTTTGQPINEQDTATDNATTGTGTTEKFSDKVVNTIKENPAIALGGLAVLAFLLLKD